MKIQNVFYRLQALTFNSISPKDSNDFRDFIIQKRESQFLGTLSKKSGDGSAKP